jgi:hypothetical protein
MTANQATVASAAIHALTFDQRNSAYEQGGKYSHNSTELLEIVRSAAKTIGDNPTFEEWTEYADEWKAGYLNDNPDHTGNAADQAWKRFSDQLNAQYGLTKPKSTSASAEKKAAEREAKAEKLAEKYADHSTEQLTDSLRKAYELQAKNPTKKLATLKELEQVVKARTRHEDTEKREALKTARARLADLAKACDDIDLLETACDLLDTASFEVTIS